MSDWQKLQLSDAPLQLIDGDRGKNYPNGTDFSDNGDCLFLSARNVSKSGFLFDDKTFISSAKDSTLRSGKLERGDVVLTTRGTVGNSAFYDSKVPYDDIRINSGMLIVRADDLFMDARYLYYFLRSSSFLTQIESLISGSAQPQLPVRDLNKVKILLPPRAEQQAIAEVIGALDDKIAANTKLAETLADMATAQFDLRTKAAALTVPLHTLVTTQYGLTTSSHEGPGPQFLRVTDINKKPWIEWATTPCCTVSESELEKYRVKPGDILVARMADPGKAAFIDIGDPEAVFASYLVRLKALDNSHALFIYYFLRSATYRNYAEGAMQGSVQKNMNAKVIVATDIRMPSITVLREFNEVVTKIRAQIQWVLKENLKLVALRDTLLPQLMSGRLMVKQAEEVVASAL